MASVAGKGSWNLFCQRSGQFLDPFGRRGLYGSNRANLSKNIIYFSAGCDWGDGGPKILYELLKDSDFCPVLEAMDTGRDQRHEER